MANAKWYFVCDTVQRVAIDLLQLPDVWRGIPDMWTKTDAELASIAEWGGEEVENTAIYAYDEVRYTEMDVDSIDTLITVRAPMVRDWLRTMRDPVLRLTDSVTASDRWDSFDVVAKNDIIQFRTALRDITKRNIFDAPWPAIPPELSDVRKFDYTALTHVSESFIAMLTTPAPEKTIEQVKADQWLRIHEIREKRKTGGVKIRVGDKDYWFWSDETSRTQYMFLADKVRRNAYPAGAVLASWKTMSGERVPLTVAMLHQIIDTGIDSESLLFEIAEEHRLAMEASEDPASYVFTDGWPLTYWEEANVVEPVNPEVVVQPDPEM